jgi:hypothetical protein
MPSIINTGSLAAKGYGFSSTTQILGGPFFINMVTFANGGPEIQCESIAVDSSGNITANGQNFNSSAPYYNYFYKLNSTGVLQWQRYVNNSYTYSTNFQYTTVDSSGNLLVTGFLTNSSSTDEEASVVQLSSSGSINWQKVRYINSTSYLQNYQIAVDSSNNVYANGRYNDSSGNNAWFMQSYSSSGGLRWGEIYPSSVTTTAFAGSGVTYDSYSGTLYWNGITSVSSNTTAVLLQTDTSGNLLAQYGKTTGVTNEDLRGREVITDSSGNVYSLCSWGSSTGIAGYFIFKYNSSGSFVWGKKVTNVTYGIQVGSIALDAAGYIYTTGYFNGSDNIGRITILKISSSGSVVYTNEIVCTTDISGCYLANGKNIIIDSNNNMYIFMFTATKAYPVIFKLPIDGSKTGTYSVVNPSPAGTYNFTYATSSNVGVNANSGSTVSLSNSVASNSFSSLTNNVTSTSVSYGSSTTTTI